MKKLIILALIYSAASEAALPFPRIIPLSTILQKTLDYTGKRDVVIATGEVAIIDKSLEVDTLSIDGTLACNPNATEPIILKAKTIYVNGTFQCGTPLNPYKAKLIISLTHSSVVPQNNFAYRGLIVNYNGKLSLNGDSSAAGWLKLAATAQPGSRSITVDLPSPFAALSKMIRPPIFETELSWKVGDEIAIGPTSYNHQEAENFKIVGVDKRTGQILLDAPLKFRHWGELEYFNSKFKGSVKLDERAEVMNLTRSIVIQAEEFPSIFSSFEKALKQPVQPTLAQTQLGGHVMVHRGGFATVEGVEFRKMGQAGIMARYPFHWHNVGDAKNQYIKNSSIHDSFQRCVTVHGTDNATVENNTCYNFRGHGFFLEDGNEEGNFIVHNLGMKAEYPDRDKFLLNSDTFQSDTDGRFPTVSVFWISHPNNTVKNNVAAGSPGTGFWMAFVNQTTKSTGGLTYPRTTNTLEFSNNIAHSSRTGFTWDGAPMGGHITDVNHPNYNPRNPADEVVTSSHYKPQTVPVFSNLTAFKNRFTGIYFRGDSVRFKNSLLADNGWSLWLAYNHKVERSVVIGRSQNHTTADDDFIYTNTRSSRYMQAGIVLYDGPFELEEIDFLSFSTAAKNYNGYNFAVVPFVGIGGTEKFINFTKGLNFGPEPLHRIYLPDSVSNDNGIRDLDGSLTGGAGKLLVWKDSMGILSSSGCSDPGPGQRYKNMLVCPEAYSESKVIVGSFNNLWSVPFQLLRSDGKSWYNWNDNKFSVSERSDVSYQLLFPFTYQENKIVTWINSENQPAQTPIIKVVAHGNNCRLQNGAQVSSLSDLRAAKVTSYFNDGADMSYKLFPTKTPDFMTPDSTMVGHALATTWNNIECDDAPLDLKIRGKITSVSQVNGSTEVKGWACHTRSHEQLQVKLSVSASPKLQKTQLQTTVAAEDSDDTVLYDCGIPYSNGKNFTLTVPNLAAAPYAGMRIYVEGVSTTGRTGYLQNSGMYAVPQMPFSPQSKKLK